MRIPPLFYLYYRLQRNFRVLRVIRGFFLGSLKARNLWGKSLIKYGLWPEINHRIIGSSEFRRNLDGNKIFNKNL